jgi:hypothetical protein
VAQSLGILLQKRLLVRDGLMDVDNFCRYTLIKLPVDRRIRRVIEYPKVIMNG